MRSQGLQADVVTYTATISACEKGRRWQRALGFFEEMRSQGLRANVITYNATISALGLLEEMYSQGLQANVITYSATISACAENGRWQRTPMQRWDAAGRPDSGSPGAAPVTSCPKDGSKTVSASGAVPEKLVELELQLAAEIAPRPPEA